MSGDSGLISYPPLPSLSDPSSGTRQVVYSFNSNIMVAAMAILFVVVLFVVGLHVYAKWFWQHGTAASRGSTTRALNLSWRRRRHRPEFVTDESMLTTTCIGLDPSTVNSLPTFIYEGTAHEAEPLLECAVCLSEFQVHDKGRILPDCKHSFHIDCIDMWFHSHSTCPLCRTPVSSPMSHQQLAGNMSNHSPPFLQHTALSTTHQQHDDGGNTSAVQRVWPPLCLLQNASVSPSTLADPHAPLPLLQSMAGLHELRRQQEEAPANNAGMVPMPCSHIPSHGEFLCRDDITRVCLPHMGASGSSSTRSMSADILRQQERATIARSTSLSLSRRILEDVQACSAQPQKSSSFRMSIKWLLSRELSKGRSKVFPSGEAISAELEQNTSDMNLPV